MLQESIRLNPGGGFSRTNDLVSLIRGAGGINAEGRKMKSYRLKERHIKLWQWVLKNPNEIRPLEMTFLR